MLNRVALATALVWFSTIVLSAQAFACKCDIPSKTDAYEASKLVFWGEVIELDQDEAVLRVEAAFKGTKRNRKLRFEMRQDSCSVAFEEGKRYIVYGSNTRDKKTKRYPSVSICSLSRELPDKPISGIMWTLADQPQWGLSRKENARYQAYRNKLVDKATSTLKSALGRCDKSVWRSKKEASGKAVVRFDYDAKRRFDVEVLEYQSSSGGEGVASCLQEALTGVKFPSFPGGPVSIRAWAVLDRLDASMVRQRSSATIVSHRSDETGEDE